MVVIEMVMVVVVKVDLVVQEMVMVRVGLVVIV